MKGDTKQLDPSGMTREGCWEVCKAAEIFFLLICTILYLPHPYHPSIDTVTDLLG